MKKTRLLMPLLLVLFSTGCASFGPTVLIKTQEPAEDFVVLCKWNKEDWFFQKGGHGGGTYQSDYKVFVTESNKAIDCGMSIWGGDGSVTFMHPLYNGLKRDGYKIEPNEEGILVLEPYTVFEKLDEKKAKFEAREQTALAGLEYARFSSMLCGFPYQYFDYYSEVKKVDKEHFRELYHGPILECKKRTFPLLNKYSPNSYPGERPSPEKSMDNLWNSEWWSNYQ